MTTIPLHYYLIVAALLFGLGAYGALTRRNAVALLMGVELMLNAANLNFLAFWRYRPAAGMEAQVFVLMVITVAAAEAAVGLALVLAVYRNFKSIYVDKVDTLKW